MTKKLFGHLQPYFRIQSRGFHWMKYRKYEAIKQKCLHEMPVNIFHILFLNFLGRQFIGQFSNIKVKPKKMFVFCTS